METYLLVSILSLSLSDDLGSKIRPLLRVLDFVQLALFPGLSVPDIDHQLAEPSDEIPCEFLHNLYWNVIVLALII